MRKLEDLQASLEGMSNNEMQSLIREIREDRKISKHAVTVPKARQDNRVAKMAAKFAGLSGEDKARFLEAMKDG